MKPTLPIAAALALAVAVLVALLWVVELYRIPGASMQPALKPSDRVAATRLQLLFGDPSRGDLVAFDVPARGARLCGATGTFIYRVVGLPRDVVAERDGVVFVNGKRLREPYLGRGRRDAMSYPPRRVPRGHYFVLGDNRTRSCDSRVWGPLPRDRVAGVVVAVYWPPGRIGLR